MRFSYEGLQNGTAVLATAAAIGVFACSGSEQQFDKPTFDPLRTTTLQTPVRVSMVDAIVSGERVDEDPQTTSEKDEYFKMLSTNGEASSLELIQAVSHASSGRFVPSAVTTKQMSAKMAIKSCFNQYDDKQLDQLESMVPPKSTDVLDLVVLNADICRSPENYEVAGFAVRDGLTVLGRDAFVDGMFTEYAAHEMGHDLGEVAPHSGVAVCEDPVRLKKCTVEAEANSKSVLSYVRNGKIPEAYRGKYTSVDLYKTNLLRESEVVTNPALGTQTTLVDVAEKGVKIIVDQTAERTAYIVIGQEPELACNEVNSEVAQEGMHVANTVSTDSGNQTMYECTSPKFEPYPLSVDVYFDALPGTDKIHAIDSGSHTTAIVNTEQFIESDSTPKTRLFRPVAKSITIGRVLDNGTRAYEVELGPEGQFIVSVVAS